MLETFAKRVADRLQRLEATGLRRSARTIETRPHGRCRTGDRDAVNFGGNDYLDLAHDPRVCAAFQQVASVQTGSTASALVAGRSPFHEQLEISLAEFEGTNSALLFPSGYAANQGILAALAEERDAVFCDRDNHASIIDAAKASRGRLLVYHRNRLNRLRQALQNRRADFDQVFIVTDGVFSMDGTVAPLPELCDIAEEFRAVVIVDEAHGTGVLGGHGRGASEFLDAESRVALRVGTLSKALGGMGGFVAADNTTIDWLRNSARTQFFSTSLPPAICAAMRESLRIINAEPSRRRALMRRTDLAHSTLRELGLKTIGEGPAPIVPVLIGEDNAAVELSNRLLDEGWFVPAIRPPTVPPGTARLRLSITCGHCDDDVVAVLKQIRRLST